MKKFLALALASVMAVSLVACGSTNADTNAESSAAATTTATTAESSSEEPGLKIAIVSSPSGVDDGSFNQDNYNGVLKFIEENPNATVTPIREETGDSAAAVQAVADVVADYDVIVCCGFQFAGIGNLAQENPDTKFILIDSWPTVDGTEVTADQVIDNVYAAYYAEQESGFYAGMAAALSTTTGKVAVVNGIAYPSNVNYQYGFECGVKYVNGTEGMNVEVVELPSYAGTDVTGANVGGNYVGNFSDEATGKVLGNALIAEGVDILFVAAGGSGNGVHQAASEVGKYVIGVDSDQSPLAPETILTSALKRVDNACYDATKKTILGTLEGGVETYDLAAGGVDIAPTTDNLSKDVLEKIEDAKKDIIAGDLVVPKNQEEFEEKYGDVYELD